MYFLLNFDTMSEIADRILEIAAALQ